MFSHDEESDIAQIEVELLQKKTVTSDPTRLTWGELRIRKDVEIVDIKIVLLGPVLPNIGKNCLRFPDVEATALLHQYEEGKWQL